ncbi:hypothetical protein [Hymenobacter mucosus]|nr:hypothetical protein [Hymenobacter mucosus]
MAAYIRGFMLFSYLAFAMQATQSERFPAKPEPFGYKLTWLAVRDADPFELLHAVNVDQGTVFSANWYGGLDKVYRWNATFITPPVDDWTFVINPILSGLSDEKTLTFLQKLSAQFAEVQFYGNHRVANYGAWGRFVNEEAIRLFSTGEAIELDQGQRTEIEEQIIEKGKQSFIEDSPDDLEQLADSFFLGDEDDVMEMAGLWSINPQTLDNQPETFALGLLIVPKIS